MRYWVSTPAYSRGGDWYNPPEFGSDVVEVDAPTKRAAIRLGLRALRKMGSRWVRDMESDKRCPLNGLKADADEEAQS